MSRSISPCTLFTPFPAQRITLSAWPGLARERSGGEEHHSFQLVTTCSNVPFLHVVMLCARVPHLPGGREDLYQLPWLYQMVQMSLFCVFDSPIQLQKSLFSFV